MRKEPDSFMKRGDKNGLKGQMWVDQTPEAMPTHAHHHGLRSQPASGTLEQRDLTVAAREEISEANQGNTRPQVKPPGVHSEDETMRIVPPPYLYTLRMCSVSEEWRCFSMRPLDVKEKQPEPYQAPT